MRRISTASPISQNESNVARYINLQLQAVAPKSLAEVAREAGLPQHNMLSMIRAGKTKLPLERIAGVAKALNVSQSHLFRLALEEYLPPVKRLLDEAGQQVVSENERKLITLWRKATTDLDPPVEPIENGLVALAQRAREIRQEVAPPRGAT